VQVHGQNGGTAVRLVRMLLLLELNLLLLLLLLLLMQVVVVMGKVMIVNQIGGIGVQIV
jgi:hypothetical protein